MPYIRYLEEMSRKYRNQQENLQRALNATMKSLQDQSGRLSALVSLSLADCYPIHAASNNMSTYCYHGVGGIIGHWALNPGWVELWATGP